jgi:hypothetical protein
MTVLPTGLDKVWTKFWWDDGASLRLVNSTSSSDLLESALPNNNYGYALLGTTKHLRIPQKKTPIQGPLRIGVIRFKHEKNNTPKARRATFRNFEDS